MNLETMLTEIAQIDDTWIYFYSKENGRWLANISPSMYTIHSHKAVESIELSDKSLASLVRRIWLSYYYKGQVND